MRLLTWHGTIIRLETTTGLLTHTRLVPVRDLGTDFALGLPDEGLAAPLAGPNEITLLPGPMPGTAHLQRRALFLSVQPGAYPLFAAETASAAETLILLADEEAAALRDLLSHAWTQAGTGAAIQPGDMVIAPGPTLTIGGTAVDLGRHRPRAGASADVLTVPHDGGEITLARVPGSRADHRQMVWQRRGPAALAEVADAAAFAATPACRLTVRSAPELAIPPILGNLADRDFVYRRAQGGTAPPCGSMQISNRVLRVRDAYVLLEGALAGVILDDEGVLDGHAAMAGIGDALPFYVGREGSRHFLDRALLNAAPALAGPHVVLPSAGEVEDWLLDAIVPLCLLAPHLPEGTRLLLPAAAATPERLALLDTFGFGGMARSEVAGPACRVAELFWAEPGEWPAEALRAARDRALARLPAAPRGRTRLELRRTGPRALANPHIADGVLNRLGFETLTAEQQAVGARIDLFRRAEIVVGAHGSDLAYVMFCPPCTQVIEVSPACEYRPAYNQICAKLGLTHAVLPCETDDGTFDGRLIISGARLNTLLGLLNSRIAA